ncbi:MAG: hypothetical protein LBH79_03175 [Nitrososphaerota archaeon]|jgi:hypothetical protein|nr:hypothetical protein [Nitrososphaerota archaeon]
MKKTLSVSILMVLICTSSYALIIPNTNAYEIEPQQAEYLTNLSSTLGLNLQAYSDITSQTYPPRQYADTVPQEDIRYQLQSPTNTLDALCSYVNGQLRMIHILENEGTLHLIKPTENTIEMTKNILDNCAQYTKDPIYTQLRTQLNEVQPNQNSTLTSENIKLDVTNTDQGTTFQWIYTANGVEAPDKCVAIHYKDGSLAYFIDNWNIYKIANTNLKLTEAEAIEIALQAADAYSWKIGPDEYAVEVKNFNVTQAMIMDTYLMNMPYADNIRGELLALYPLCHVWVSLDKFYPGNVYGIEVFIWADTKEVCYVHERISTLDPPEDQVASNEDVFGTPPPMQANFIPAVMLLAAVGVFALGLRSVLLIKKQAVSKRFFKLSGVLLCVILVSSMFVSLAVASGAEPTRRAIIWGSESLGAPPSTTPNPNSPSYRKTQAEINAQQLLSAYIEIYFDTGGYVTSNKQGAASKKLDILNDIYYSQQDYSKAAYVDFNHGVGVGLTFPGATDEFHYMFEDNIGTTNNGTPTGNGVFDYEIYRNTSAGKAFFTFINTCKSASISSNLDGTILNPAQGLVAADRVRGMPYAWTHKLVGAATSSPPSGYMSGNGYNNADSGAFCYIGFPHGSAALDQSIHGSSSVKYNQWVEGFFYYALGYDMTVNQALDHASQERFNINFDATDLYTGFTAHWPTWNGTAWDDPPYFTGCTMAVYGNGNIRLYEYIVRSPTNFSYYGSGWVSNIYGFVGPHPDGSCTGLTAIGTGDQAMITGALGYSGADQARGRIWVYGYSSGYTSRLRVYVSNDNVNWYLVNGNILVSSGGSRWIDCGNYASNFKYITFTVYRENSGDYGNNLFIDNVLVLPPTP